MRFLYALGIVLVACGVATGQQSETEFPVGPQYLITQPYPTLLQPIATPSYAPWEPLGVVSPQTGEAGPVMISVPAYLPSVYWGYPAPGELQVAPEETAPEARNLPQDYVDTGVTAIATAGWLENHDAGMSLAEAAHYWREHSLPIARMYTNQDIERIQGQ
jgi:hypothetical protein